MPNWCQNSAVFKHKDAAEVARLLAAFKKGCLFNEFLPLPNELEDTTSPVPEQDAKRAAQLSEKYGYSNWYDWQVANWGTKWDVDGEGGYGELKTDDPNAVSLYFDTAWAPPINFYYAMVDMGWSITAYYYEAGMSYCGIFEDDDNYIEITGDSRWAEKNIPKELDEMFGISNEMAEWEEENLEEEDGSD
jgi:hypothetical protein